eukprot:symbB.v1.2.008009.t1/scaffold498.1/size458234/1
MRFPEVHPKTAMKKLFWNPLKLGEPGETTSVWESIYQTYKTEGKEEAFNLLYAELEKDFAEVFGSTSPQKRPTTHQQKRRRVLDEKRRRELWFMLALMPERSLLLKAIEEMDDETLKPEKVELLQMNLPSAADIEMIQTSLMNAPLAEGELWDTPEEFVLAISEIPQFTTRVKMWGFLNSVDWAISRLLTAQQELWIAAETLRHSETLEHILGLALFIGNYLNGGTSRGRADGFDLEALPKMSKLRGKGHDTLLDFLVTQAAKSMPGKVASLFQPQGEAEAIHKAKAHCVNDAMEEAKTLISQAAGFLPHSAQASSKALEQRKVKLQESLAKLNEVMQKFHEWEIKYEELCHWFQMQDARQRSCEDFFGLWESFLNDLKKSWESHQQREQLAHLKSRRRSLSAPPAGHLKRRSVPVLSAVQGSKTPSASPRARKELSLRRRTAHGIPSFVVQDESRQDESQCNELDIPPPPPGSPAPNDGPKNEEAYKKANRSDLSLQMIEKLTHNAVLERRFKDQVLAGL